MLTDTAVKQAKPKEKLYKMGDSDGLSLWVQAKDKGGGKLWRLQYSFQGKVHRMSVGTYPEISLGDARKRRDACRKMVAQGIDPLKDKREKQQTVEAEAQEERNTFAHIAEQWSHTYFPGLSEKHAKRLKDDYLQKRILPLIGHRPVTTLTPQDFLAIYRPVAEKHGTTAGKMANVCNQVMEYARIAGLIPFNPARDLSKVLPSVPVTHMASITEPKEVGALLRDIYSYKGRSLLVGFYLKILPLVFTRLGELSATRWEEFDFTRAIWDIPKERMKMRNDHNVPLASQTIALLEELRQYTGHSQYLFPGQQGNATISDNSARQALRDMGYTGNDGDKAKITPHGFRAMARTMLAERLHFPPEVIEHQLAHKVSDTLGTAYNRTKYLAQRKELMQAWADYLDELRTTKD